MNINSLPSISVIIPVYNGEDMIASCLESILAVEYPKEQLEIIVVDNRSVDKTPDIVRQYPVQYIREDRIQSAYIARNAGISSSTGEILAFTDADCVASREWLKYAIPSFEDAEVGCVAGGIQGYPGTSEVETYLIKRGILNQKGTFRHPYMPYAQTGNAIYRRAVIKKIGVFAPWTFGGDADLTWRMLTEMSYKLVYVPEAVVFHRHQNTIKGLYKQRERWGYGTVTLYKKYRCNGWRRRWRSGGRGWARIPLLANRVLINTIHRRIHSNVELDDTLLDLISIIGTKVGIVKGCIAHRCFYL
jgi:cellulose synthase/poly-beta-1,6-N-acetylglucosamine synthase-like glycosyltransferase